MNGDGSKSPPLCKEMAISKFWAKLFTRAEFDTATRQLPKVLSLVQLVPLGIACTIGAGAYSIIGLVAQSSGPSAMLTFVIVGAMCFFTSLPYAEFASRIPSAGFAYSYVSSTCGEFLGYITGCLLFFGILLGTAICARCLASYIASFLGMFGFNIPMLLYDWHICGLKLSILGGCIVLAMCVLMLRGMKMSTLFSNITSSLNVIILLFSIIAGMFYIEPQQYLSDYFPFGFRGLLSGIGLAFYAFMGFEELTCYTEESLRPQQDIPCALTIVLLITMFIYSLLALIMTGMAPLSVMNKNESLVAVFLYRSPAWISLVISCGSIAGLTSSTLSCLMIAPRVLYSMSTNCLLPSAFGHLNPNTQVLDVATVFVCALTAAMTIFCDVQTMGNLSALCGILISSVVDLALVVKRCDSPSYQSRWVSRSCTLFFVLAPLCGAAAFGNSPTLHVLAVVLGATLALIYLYIRQQEQTNLPKHFRCPGVPLVPLIGAACLLFLSAALEVHVWVSCGIVVLIAVASYFLYGFWQPSQPSSTAKIDEPEEKEGKDMELLEQLRQSN